MESQLSSQVLTSVNVRRYAFVLQCEGCFNFSWEAIDLLCAWEMSGRIYIEAVIKKYKHLPFLVMFRLLFPRFVEKHWTANLESFLRLQFSFHQRKYYS